MINQPALSRTRPSLIRGQTAARPSWSLTLGMCLIVLSLILPAYAPMPELRSTEAVRSDPIFVLAYYYIWFDSQSWDRAKRDYPLMGRYSSDDPDVMRQHIEWAKAAGIDGFIVSWKSAEKLNRRLTQLIEIADEENFKLAIIYESLDFNRDPLPVGQVSADLDYFIVNFAGHAPFDLYTKPMIIWSGTRKFSREDIQTVTQGRREYLHILAAENNVDGYLHLADLVDGNAYYWSSVNPYTHPGYAEKLITMGEAVHANGGLWIAPAAPGYNSLLLGGTTVVDRKNGETLQKEMNTAFQSAPDAIGIISWNEFSENTHIEPSLSYGNLYLKILTDLRSAVTPTIGDFDSSMPGDTLDGLGTSRLVALGLLGALVFTGLSVIIWRIKQENSRGHIR